MKEETYKELYSIVSEIRKAISDHEKNLRIKETGGRYNEIEHMIAGLQQAERFILERIDKYERPEKQKLKELVE